MSPVIAETDFEIAYCFRLMQQLRPHISATDFVERVKEQVMSGYRLAYLRSGDDVVSLIGFRILENLAWGRFLYVDDLVTDEQHRRRGYATILLTWVERIAREQSCQQLHLDSGLSRKSAHQFYKSQNLVMKSFHFSTVVTNTARQESETDVSALGNRDVGIPKPPIRTHECEKSKTEIETHA
jgi:GNAT superfamily N-acetyltransferase